MSVATVADAASRPTRVPVIVQRLALALLLLGAWWLISLAVPPYVLPQPERVFARLVQLTQSGDLPINLLTTLGRVLAGFALAVAIGVPGGILLGSHRALGTFFEPVLPVLNTVSSAIWAIFAIIWFGLSPMTPILWSLRRRCGSRAGRRWSRSTSPQSCRTFSQARASPSASAGA